MADLLTARDIKERYGISRSTLLRYEQERKLHPARAAGRGYRRYDAGEIEGLMRNAPPPSEMLPGYDEFGVTGLRRWGGSIYEERLEELRGRKGLLLYREMRNNDPVIASVMFALESILKQARARVSPASESDADKEADNFIESCLFADMEYTWSETLDFILQMMESGFMLLEPVYKKRLGLFPPGYCENPYPSSFSDGRIGWAKWAPRGAETLADGDEWVFDDAGKAIAINQQPESDGGVRRVIPMDRLILFRTTPVPNDNPMGRALALDTPVPTPDGWNDMAHIKVGDKVYGADGKIRYVVAKSEVWKNRSVYELEFSGKSKIVADENHLWRVTCSNDRQTGHAPRVMTTKAIYEWLTGHKGKNALCLCVGEAMPLDAANLDLPIDPYVLGYWLGDGNRTNGVIACHPDDLASLREQVEAVGLSMSHNGKDAGTVSDIRPILRRLGVLGNKHIPAPYLRAGYEQRLALLQGLMDSDGMSGCSETAHDRCSSFSNIDKKLVDQVVELVRSLGGRPTVRKGNKPGHICGTINGRPIIQRSQMYQVCFFLPAPCHRLPRKLVRQSSGSFKARSFFIKSIRPLEERADTVCIEVDSPDHLFLAGRAMVPTHNSLMRAMYVPYYYSKNLAEIEGIGIERDLVGVPVMYLGEDTNKAGTNSDWELAVDLVTNLRKDEQAGVVIPHAKMSTTRDGHGMQLELLSSESTRQHDVTAIIERYDKRKALAILAQFVMLGMERVGSYALAKQQNDLFAMSATAWLTNIADTINRKAIPKLFRYNVFPEITDYPKLVFSDAGIPDLMTLSTYINTLSNQNLLQPSTELEQYLRLIARLPLLTGDQGQQRQYRGSVNDQTDLARKLVRLLAGAQQTGVGTGMLTEDLGQMIQQIDEQVAS